MSDKKEFKLIIDLKTETEVKTSITVKVPVSVKQVLDKAREMGITTTQIVIAAAEAVEKQLIKK